jgi:hypothetical protein
MAVSAVDFVSTPKDVSAGACHGKPTGSASVELTLKHIRSAISDNVVVLAISAAIVSVSLGIVWFCYRTLSEMFAEWRKHQLTSSSEKIMSSTDADDAVYRSGGAGAFDDLPQTSEGIAIAARMKGIASLYTPYNDAMKARAANRDEIPDDLIDQRIMTRSDDDFRYPRRRPDRLRFRPGAGAQKVYASFAEGDIGLRNPVYKTS